MLCVPDAGAPVHLVVMGVSGCGKSSLSAALARRWSHTFVEGDDFHPRANVEKMSSGIPLDDADRWPWLDDLATAMRTHAPCIASCSALKFAYRSRLRAGIGPQLRFVMLDLSRAALEARLAQQADHYMPLALLDSQLTALEFPGSAEPDVLVVNADGTLAAMEEMVAEHFDWS